MKVVWLLFSVYLGTCACAFAQSSGATSAGSSAAGATGSSPSSGGMVNGTGGSPGPNTSNALRHGTTGNNLSVPQTGGQAGPAPHGNAVDTPAANRATQSLGNTDAGVLKK